MTGCVRTYAVNQGLDEVPRIARDLGMKVMLGAWIGDERDKNEQELARRHRSRAPISRDRQRGDRRQRGSAAARTAGRRAGGDDPPRPRRGRRAGDLRRRLGVLAEAPGGGRRRRFRHHPHAALLGGRAASAIDRGDPARRGDLAADAAPSSAASRCSSARPAGRRPGACARARCPVASIRRGSSAN